jgi:Kef-type K+ transport system membrane component KefB
VEGDFARSGFSDALVILGAAGIVIPAFARFRISPIIGFILIGMLVGPAGLGRLTGGMPWLHYVTISNPHGVEPFAELGIVLLLFSVGLELSFRRLWSLRRLVFGVGAGTSAALTFAASGRASSEFRITPTARSRTSTSTSRSTMRSAARLSISPVRSSSFQ